VEPGEKHAPHDAAHEGEKAEHPESEGHDVEQETGHAPRENHSSEEEAHNWRHSFRWTEPATVPAQAGLTV